MPGGVHQWHMKPYYDTYRSPYGPKYTIKPNLHGVNSFTLKRYFFTLGGFGAVAAFTVLYFAEGIPRVQKDILQRVPGLGDYWVKDTPSSDDPF